jgi:plastocyanin
VSASGSAAVAGTVGAIKTITITAKDYSFSPTSITVKKGERVQLILSSTQGAHDIKIDGLGVASKTLNTGETTSVEFTPTKAGTYEYYCSIGNHRAMGMRGTLIVE